MPALSPDDRIHFLQAWTLTRLLAWVLCFGAPLVFVLAVAIFGLVAGVLVGPGAGVLVLLLFLVPPAGYLILVPGPQVWLAVLEEGRRG